MKFTIDYYLVKQVDITQFLEVLVKQGGSDLFFSTGAQVSIKVEGESRPISKHTLPPDRTRQFAYSLMNDNQVKEFEEELEMNLGVSIPGLGRFRVNVFLQRGEVSMVVRYIPPTPTSFRQLKLPDFLSEYMTRKQGLILVTGATGSGKSTTLAAMINYRNTNYSGHILTIEDPIEYIHQHDKSVVDQREVGSDTKSFANALKNAMREAPDVILIGEIRDLETMRHAIAYAETGHLCLATIHAANAVETLDRIINFYPQESHHQLLLDLSRNFVSIISQRLVKGIDGRRLPCLEVLTGTPYVRELIQNGNLDGIREAMERHLDSDTCTFDEALIQLYQDGLISLEQALDNADSRHNVSVKVRLANNQGSTGNFSME